MGSVAYRLGVLYYTQLKQPERALPYYERSIAIQGELARCSPQPPSRLPLCAARTLHPPSGETHALPRYHCAQRAHLRAAC